MRPGPRARWPLGAPIAVQMLALLAGGLVVAQLVTVLVVILAPQEPPKVYRIAEVVAALRGTAFETRDGGPLVRSLRAAPPAVAATSNRFDVRSRRELAAILGVGEDRVRLEMHRAPFPENPSRRRAMRAFDERFGERPPGGPGQFAGEPAPPSDFIEPGALRTPGTPETPAERLSRRVRFNAFMAGRPLVGGFTAALQEPDGRWAVVEPAIEPFLSPWQQRILLWFLGCILVLAPLAYLFARHITAPIGAFARAAEQIGRDPTAPLIQLSGPAEIGMAARALNDMQVRLKRYVQDRTATIAAVSHDLRTPLARMRFKLEKAPPELKAALERDVDQMEQMVGAVLEFVREGAESRPRDRLDLLSAVECVVDDAAATGALVELASGEPVIVEADALGLERLFANLVANAWKYGGAARVTVRAEGGEGVEITDQGPGLPPSELERVFQPFYRTEPSRNRDTGGIGLGLAVARSIARAHGGDVSLTPGAVGLIARVRLPLAPA